MNKAAASFLCFCLFFLNNQIVFAQNKLAKSDDLARISLTAYIPDQVEGLPDIAKGNLTNKLNYLVTQSGMSGGDNNRFIITASLNINSKDVVGVPAKTQLKLDLTLYIGDGIEGNKYSSVILPISGVGNNETQAYIQALNKINLQNPNIQKFINDGKSKIIEYYNSKCDFIIKEAQSMASRNEFESAIFKLSSVPEVCKDCYDKSMDAISVVFKAKMERECQSNIAKSKSLKTQEKFDEAAEVLSTILPDLSCYKEAQVIMTEINDHKCAVAMGIAKGAWAAKDVDATSDALKNVSSDSKCYTEGLALSNEVRAWVKLKDGREWAFKMQEQKDEVDIRKQSIKAARDVGVAYGNNQPKTVITYNVRGWYLK